jgi:uncharacterized protein YjbI with pentapeptide repeats
MQLFTEINANDYRLSLFLKRLQIWLNNFISSREYQEVKLFSSVDEAEEKTYWSHHYISYLLAPQYIDLRNPIEQREAARKLAKQLRERFKFDLAMYTARSQSAISQGRASKNPTRLGDTAIHLIKNLVARRGLFSYVDLANLFINQNQQVSYKFFKQNLQKYIFYSLDVENQSFLKNLKTELAKKLEYLYENRHEDILNNSLILRTCNQIVNYFTTENQQKPASLFVLSISQGETLTLSIILLKIILLCKNARNHLDSRIANLIQYYEKFSREECENIIHFLEVFNILFTIYAENVEYNLVNIKNRDRHNLAELDTYRVFSQLKSDLNLAGANLSDTDLHDADLSSVNLNGADLSNVNLSGADLSNANLIRANLSHANLSHANLRTADLNEANLQETNLYNADLRRANLSRAKLSNANLSTAKLRFADLSYADLNSADLNNANLNQAKLHQAKLLSAKLNGTNLNAANLSDADLRGANLRSVDLSSANLNGANLSGANLNHAILIDADLRNANLTGANLGRADLSGANLNYANLSQVKVDRARFMGNLGLSEHKKLELKRGGAIWES